MEFPKQFDNISQRVIDDLRATLKGGSKVAMAAASFSMYAFESLQKELERVDELRFIFTSPTFNKEREKKQKREFYIPKLSWERTLYGSDFAQSSVKYDVVKDYNELRNIITAD